MRIKVTRKWFTQISTIGELSVNGHFECFTLEDKVRAPTDQKVFGQTAIPAGEYEVIINQSARFGRPMPLLLNVPGFMGVRIHAGNTPKDTEGCLLVGTARTDGDSIQNSRSAFAALYNKLFVSFSKNEKITIEILNGGAYAASTLG